MEIEVAVNLLATLVLGCSILAVAYWQGRDILLGLRFICSEGRLRKIATGCLIVALLCGAVRQYQMREIRDAHTVEDYRFEFITQRDPDWGDEVRYDVTVSVSRAGAVRAERVFIGYLIDPEESVTFHVTRLPNESLIIGTPTDHTAEVVFAYDTATGECFPWYDSDTEHDDAWRKRLAQWEVRVRACPGYEQHQLSGLLIR
jgi:hypothetical protein